MTTPSEPSFVISSNAPTIYSLTLSEASFDKVKPMFEALRSEAGKKIWKGIATEWTSPIDGNVTINFTVSSGREEAFTQLSNIVNHNINYTVNEHPAPWGICLEGKPPRQASGWPVLPEGYAIIRPAASRPLPLKVLGTLGPVRKTTIQKMREELVRAARSSDQVLWDVVMRTDDTADIVFYPNVAEEGVYHLDRLLYRGDTALSECDRLQHVLLKRIREIEGPETQVQPRRDDIGRA